MKNVSSFEFRPVTVTKVNEEPLRLNPKKAFMIHNIPARVLKENKEIFTPWLAKIFNNSISQNEFPDDLKLGDITPLFRRMKLRISIITDPLPYCPLSLKYLSVSYTLR